MFIIRMIGLTIIIMKQVENGFHCVNNGIKLKLFAFRKIHFIYRICLHFFIIECLYHDVESY